MSIANEYTTGPATGNNPGVGGGAPGRAGYDGTSTGNGVGSKLKGAAQLVHGVTDHVRGAAMRGLDDLGGTGPKHQTNPVEESGRREWEEGLRRLDGTYTGPSAGTAPVAQNLGSNNLRSSHAPNDYTAKATDSTTATTNAMVGGHHGGAQGYAGAAPGHAGGGSSNSTGGGGVPQGGGGLFSGLFSNGGGGGHGIFSDGGGGGGGHGGMDGGGGAADGGGGGGGDGGAAAM